MLKLASLCVYIVVVNSEVKCIRNPPSASKCKKVDLILFIFKLYGVPENVYLYLVGSTEVNLPNSMVRHSQNVRR